MGSSSRKMSMGSRGRIGRIGSNNRGRISGSSRDRIDDSSRGR